MADELKPAYLLAGQRPPEGRPRRRRGCAPLRAQTRSSSTHAETMSGEDAVAACNALGLFARRRPAVVVDGVEAWKADDAKAIAAYLKAPAPATTLALVGGELKKDAPLAKAVARDAARSSSGTCPQKISQRWVAEQFKLHGANAEPEACRALIELVGDDLYELAAEIDKLATWAAGEPSPPRTSRRSSRRAPRRRTSRSPTPGARATSPASCEAAERLLERTGDPRSRTIPRVGDPHEPRRALRPCQGSRREGLSAKDAAARLKQHPFYVQKLYAQARNFTPRSSRRDCPPRRARPRAQGRLAPPAELELERALVEITAARGVPAPQRVRRTRPGRAAAPPGTSCARRVPVQRAAGDRPVDQLDEAAMLGLDRVGVAVLDRRREPLRQRLDRRAVAQVLEPLVGGGTNALLLLPDVRHARENARARGPAMVPEALRGAGSRDPPAGRRIAASRVSGVNESPGAVRARPAASSSSRRACSSPHRRRLAPGRPRSSRRDRALARPRARARDGRVLLLRRGREDQRLHDRVPDAEPRPGARRRRGALVGVRPGLQRAAREGRAQARVACRLDLFWLMLLGLTALSALFILSRRG